MSFTVWPWADIITTMDPCSLTGSFEVRPIRCRRRPSSMLTGRTNTSRTTPQNHLQDQALETACIKTQDTTAAA